MRWPEDIGGDDFWYCGDKANIIRRTMVQWFVGTGRRETNQTDREATAARHGSLTAKMLAARAGAVGHPASLGGKLKNVCRGRERHSVKLRLSDQGQNHGAD